MWFRVLLVVALVALALPVAASAATIFNTPTESVYEAAPGDLVEMHVYLAFDSDVADTAVFYLPNSATAVDPTTADPNCRSRPTGASSCGLGTRQRTRIQLAERDDFVAVDSGTDTVEVHLGEGTDRVWSVGSKLEAFGDGGDDWLQGGSGLDKLDGGIGDDLLDPNNFGDIVSGGPGFDTTRTAGGAEGVVVTLDGVANDGRLATPSRAADNQNIKPDVERVLGGLGNDQIEGNAQNNTLSGGDGADSLTGLSGADILYGDAGDDRLNARDGLADTVDCGPGASDTAVVDPMDTVSPNCETVQYADEDRDGVNARDDCNDRNPAIFPGAIDVPGNGVDEDCSGADARRGVIDADSDGAVVPQDCDDANRAIHPGAIDRPGNAIDENCDGVDAAFPRIESPIKSRWRVARHYTMVVRLLVDEIPAGGSVKVRCSGKGCPFKRRRAVINGGAAKLTKLFKGRRLRRDTTLEIRITAPDMIGKVVRYTIRKRKLPASSSLCLPPGAARPRPC